MAKARFWELLREELERIDKSSTDKRHERIIEGFTKDHKAIVNNKSYLLFNSNDYLGLRFEPRVIEAEEKAAKRYGTGPGAVRFISGTMDVHRKLEEALARFHNRENAIVFSSAFAANMAVLHCLIKGQSKDSVIGSNTLVISDELNHRSIIDGIRVAQLPKEQKLIFKHLDLDMLDNILEQNADKFKRVLVVSDGIFSMLGEYQDIGKMMKITDKHDTKYEEGILCVVDDSHGVGCFGPSGRGTEEIGKCKCQLLVGTLGKGFGCDGGYAVGNRVLIEYLRESAATYIYSNPISPAAASSALVAVGIADKEGDRLLRKLNSNIKYFKEKMRGAGFSFAADSIHPIQPVLIGDTELTKRLTNALWNEGIIVTNINYPVVPMGKDEIRVQISAAHSRDNIDEFISKISRLAKSMNLICGRL